MTNTTYMPAPGLNVHKNEEASVGKEYYVRGEDRYFYVGSLVGELLLHFQESLDLDKSVNRLAERYQVSREEIYSLAQRSLVESGLIRVADQSGPSTDDISTAPKTSYIKFKCTLFPQPAATFAGDIFSFAYKPTFAAFLIIIATISYGLLFSLYGLDVLSPTRLAIIPILFTAREYVIFFAAMISVYILHEFGHAAAARHHNVRVRRIGFGIYFVFPVFFTDISDAWSVSRRKRITLNLGGIYFQFVIAAIATWIAIIWKSEIALFILMLNFWSIAICLLPFLRFDGYWLYSDYFNLPNLRPSANKMFIELARLKNLGSWTFYKSHMETNPALFAYCIVSVCFLGIFAMIISSIVFTFLKSFPSTLQQLFLEVMAIASFSDVLTVLFHAVFFALVILIMTILVRAMAKIMLNIYTLLREQNSGRAGD